MATKTMVYTTDHIRDYNTTQLVTDPVTGDTLSQTVQTNTRLPLRYLTADAQANVAAATTPPQGIYDPDGDGVANPWIKGSGVIGSESEVDLVRFTFQLDADSEVIPGSQVGIEYTTDSGTTWHNFYDDTDLEEAGYSPYIALFDEGVNTVDDDADWIGIAAYNDTNGNFTGFLLADNFSLTTGQTFTTNDPPNAANPQAPFTDSESEFLGICFTSGMKIETENGEVAVEDLKIGDRLQTFDHDYQPIRAIFRRKMRATGGMRPVRFERWAIGNREAIVVSQKHRFLVSALPEDIRRSFGLYQNNLVQASQLINNSTIRLATDLYFVEYFHIMLDRHELLYCHGSISESWQPHRRNLRRDKALQAELLAIFPELAEKTTENGGGPVRGEVTFMPITNRRTRPMMRS